MQHNLLSWIFFTSFNYQHICRWESCCSVEVYSKSDREESCCSVEDFALWPDTFELCDMKGDDEVGECMAMFIRPFRDAAESLGLDVD